MLSKKDIIRKNI